MNLALDALPSFTALRNSAEGAAALSGRIHIGPGIDYLERAFDHSKYGEFSAGPYLDVMIPTLLDASLAPAGKHVMSICMQFAPYKLKTGDWSAKDRDACRARSFALFRRTRRTWRQRYSPPRLLTPKDLEDEYGLTGGHPFHGELSLDQLFTMRPQLGWARYRTPVQGLYLCSNGTHPGNGLTGVSGANAAREILKDLRR